MSNRIMEPSHGPTLLNSGLATVAIRAPNIAFIDFHFQPGNPVVVNRRGYDPALVLPMVKLQNHRVALPAIHAGVLEKIPV